MDHPSGSIQAQRRMTLVAFLVLLIAVLVLTLLMVLPYVLAVTMGGILAVLSEPIFQWLTGHHISARVAAAVVVLGVVLGLMAPLAFIVTKAIQQGIAIGQGLAEGGVSLRSLLDHVSGWAPIETLIGSPDAFETQARRWMQSAGTGASAMIVGLAAHLPNLVLQLALASIADFFLLVDGPRFLGWRTDKLPIAADVREQVGQSFQETAISVIWANHCGGGRAKYGDVAGLSPPGRAGRLFGRGRHLPLRLDPAGGEHAGLAGGRNLFVCPGGPAENPPHGGLWPAGGARR
jgi:predicted PurR-regulated permease PerM